MTDIQYTFCRHEKKYLLTRAKFHEIRKALAPYMTDDEYGLHTIHNIYFDTPDFLMTRHSLTHPQYKEKFRQRSYGRTGEESPAYAEIKKKYRHEFPHSSPLWLASMLSERELFPVSCSKVGVCYTQHLAGKAPCLPHVERMELSC